MSHASQIVRLADGKLAEGISTGPTVSELHEVSSAKA
jgi:hypothetical protein